jgi:hypothetical protein
MEKIKYFTQKELKKLFRSIERQKDCADFYWGTESLLQDALEERVLR